MSERSEKLLPVRFQRIKRSMSPSGELDDCFEPPEHFSEERSSKHVGVGHVMIHLRETLTPVKGTVAVECYPLRNQTL